MKVWSRFVKLLETATHPSATDNERINALNACRRMSEQAGGIECLLREGIVDEESNELVKANAALAHVMRENIKLKAERDALILALKRESGSPKKNPSNNPSSTTKKHGAKRFSGIILSSLTKEWQELHRIHENAKKYGFEGTSADTKKLLHDLCIEEKAVWRERGVFPDARGHRRWQAQCWKLRAKGFWR